MMTSIARVPVFGGLGIVMACSVVACGDRPRSGASAVESTAAVSPAVVRAESLRAHAPALARIAWHPYGDPRPDTTDLGTGLVALAIGMDTGRAYPREDTLLFRAEPRADGEVIGALIVERPDQLTWEYAALVPPDVQLNFLEYGYEESGVPTDSADATGRWVRGILGFTKRRAPHRGWASLDAKGVVPVDWRDRLARDGIPSFLDTAMAILYPTLADAQSGNAGDKPPSANYEFEEILERQAHWLRVRMRWPYDSCSTPVAGTQSREVWIRYLDDRGRPLVFYRTRGC